VLLVLMPCRVPMMERLHPDHNICVMLIIPMTQPKKHSPTGSIEYSKAISMNTDVAQPCRKDTMLLAERGARPQIDEVNLSLPGAVHLSLPG
jgi:hypothetical protein